ncbi:MAG: hypothetical protein WKF91_21645 [Segetibacter sp.]
MPKVENGIYSITLNNTVLEIDPQTGGRVTSLKLDGKNFFTGKEVNANYWGSTLWPSPQKDWGGAPPPELNNQPYSVQVNNNVIKMVSRKDSKFGYMFSEEFLAFGVPSRLCSVLHLQIQPTQVMSLENNK